MSYDPNDPNGSCQTMLAVGLIVGVLVVIALAFGAVKLAKHFL
jgi:hypothetical protein